MIWPILWARGAGKWQGMWIPTGLWRTSTQMQRKYYPWCLKKLRGEFLLSWARWTCWVYADINCHMCLFLNPNWQGVLPSGFHIIERMTTWRLQQWGKGQWKVKLKEHSWFNPHLIKHGAICLSADLKDREKGQTLPHACRLAPRFLPMLDKGVNLQVLDHSLWRETVLPGHPCLNFFAESDTPHPCRIPTPVSDSKCYLPCPQKF